MVNIVRIALLVSLGAHISPEIALTGFHSQAGWMMFLTVAIGVMATAHRVPFFRLPIAEDSAAPSAAYREAIVLLAPFLAMTAASIVGAAFSGDGHWLYFLRVIAVGAAIVYGWRYYRRLQWRKIGWPPLLPGLGVGLVWIATDPGQGRPSALGGWLATLPPAAFAAWMMLRVAGMILLAPFAEELAFRGYLHRKLVAGDFDAVAEGAFSWKAFLISSALFGLMHERWLSGALAGAVFALALYRSGKITGAIIAHVAANALIALWAIAFAQWSLL